MYMFGIDAYLKQGLQIQFICLHYVICLIPDSVHINLSDLAMAGQWLLIAVVGLAGKEVSCHSHEESSINPPPLSTQNVLLP